MANIYLLEDDKRFIAQAEDSFQEAHAHTLYPLEAQLSNKAEYWRNLDIMPHDLVVLDLNLQLAGARWTGLEVLQLLDNEKKAGRLPGLERVLIATGVPGQVDPENIYPEIGFVSRFKVYGMEKGEDSAGRTSAVGYGASLVRKVEAIIAGTEEELNNKPLDNHFDDVE